MKEELEKLRGQLIKIVFDNNSPQACVVKGRVVSVSDDCVTVETFNNRHIIPFSQIIKVRVSLKRNGGAP